MKRFVTLIALGFGLTLVGLSSILLIRWQLAQGELRRHLSIRDNTEVLCCGNSHSGCTWADSPSNGVQVLWYGATPLAVTLARLEAIEVHGGFGSVRTVAVDVDLVSYYCMDEKTVINHLCRQFPITRSRFFKSGVNVFDLVTHFVLPVTQEWKYHETPPGADDTLRWIKENPMAKQALIAKKFTLHPTLDDETALVRVVAEIRKVCERNGVRLILFASPLPSDNPGVNSPEANRLIARLRGSGYTYLDYRTACPDSDFRDADHLHHAARLRFTCEHLKDLK